MLLPLRVTFKRSVDPCVGLGGNPYFSHGLPSFSRYSVRRPTKRSVGERLGGSCATGRTYRGFHPYLVCRGRGLTCTFSRLEALLGENCCKSRCRCGDRGFSESFSTPPQVGLCCSWVAAGHEHPRQRAAETSSSTASRNARVPYLATRQGGETLSPWAAHPEPGAFLRSSLWH